MFNLLNKKNNGIRKGTFLQENKKILTPCYFLISNFGGGGTNVSRFVSYLDIFEKSESQLLLNYYYLNTDFKKPVAFDSDVLAELPKNEDIIKFLKKVRAIFVKQKKRAFPEYTYKETGWLPQTMLDSGSGNIFRDYVQNGKLTPEHFEEIFTKEIKQYLAFAKQHAFDVIIAFDVAGKYTAKKGEHVDQNYKENLQFFSNPKFNMNLLEICLKILKEEKILQPMVFAPLHGKNKQEFLDNLHQIVALEKKISYEFHGFALGGLGNLRRDLIYDISREVRDFLESVNDNRPVHALGVGAIQNIIPLSLCGIDSFDCHSPWRRASEGKFLTPLINSKCEVVAKDNNYWQYVPIDKFESKNFKCDCDVCKQYSLNALKNLFSKGGEYAYFAKVLFFKHNISQQEFLCKLVREKEINEVFESIPDSKYKETLASFINKKASKKQAKLF
jgi:tRNA-guanine family transglycosylase